MPQMAIMGGMALGSSLLDRFANRKTAGEKAMEANMLKQGALADQVGMFAQGQHNMAQPALQKAMGYYTKLASGDRSAIQAQLAPQINQLTDVYRGAEQGMMRTMGAGPQRDRQMAELSRQKAGQLGNMGFAARDNAMGQLGSMGNDMMGRVLQAYGQQGNILSGQQYGQQALANAQNQRQQWIGKLGGNLMDMFLPMMRGMGGGGGGMLPSSRVPGSNVPYRGPQL